MSLPKYTESNKLLIQRAHGFCAVDEMLILNHTNLIIDYLVKHFYSVHPTKN